MLVSLNWLKDYTDVNVTIDEFLSGMIMSGSNLETCKELGTGIEGVVIGKIEKIEKHPDADKLVVCSLNVGTDDRLQIVTGATNVYEGAFVPVAMDGSRIPALHGQPKKEGGVKIRRGELRGVVSDGMLCGPQELGLDDKVAPYISKDGIWLLPGDWSDMLGKDIVEALGLKDYVIDFEITPNRPDCLSMIGMAREAAATFGTELRYPDTDAKTCSERAEDYISVEVKSDLCKRYTARVIKDVKIEQSPWWLQKRLIAAGMRPINNIVDITNFVMLEYGQPLHAFDIRQISDRKIIVDFAKEGDKFTTLDGTERSLFDDTLMINDGKQPIGIAGIMGGLDSEIVEDTDTVVLESATFNKTNIRTSSKKLGLRTESSSRYEKGIDPNLAKKASDRVCKLIEILGCGTVLEGAIDIYDKPETAKTVTARVSRINKVLGTDLKREEMVKLLSALEMKVEGEGDNLVVTPNSVRQDLLEEVDYVEEVARMYGYDKLPMTLPNLSSKAEFSKSWNLRDVAKDALCAMGANEIKTFSFTSEKELDSINIAEDSWERNFVEIINPMGEDTKTLRTILTPAMIQVLARNESRGVEAVRAYEIDNVFFKNLEDEKALPIENLNLSIGVYGKDEDFFTLKGMIETLLERLGIKDVRFVAEREYGVYHPGRCARIVAKDKSGIDVELGIMGELHPKVMENYDLEIRTYCAEMFFDVITELSNKEVAYKQPPKYPSTSRDIALIVSEDAQVYEIERVIREAGTEILRDVKLFDVYRGEQVGAGKKSVAFSITYRHDDKTLTDDEVESVHSVVVEALREKLGAVLRD